MAIWASIGAVAAGAVRAGGIGRPARALQVLEAGALTLVQDLGRAGHASVGVSPSGAADRTSGPHHSYRPRHAP